VLKTSNCAEGEGVFVPIATCALEIPEKSSKTIADNNSFFVFIGCVFVKG
jgi:hypothetical protein